MDTNDLISLAIAFGLGMLVGIQRQKTDHEMAGVRTFTLISILVVIVGFLTRAYDNPFILPVSSLGLTAVLIIASVLKLKRSDETDIGQITEVVALWIGVYLVFGNQAIGAMVIVFGSKKIINWIEITFNAVVISELLMFGNGQRHGNYN